MRHFYNRLSSLDEGEIPVCFGKRFAQRQLTKTIKRNVGRTPVYR